MTGSHRGATAATGRPGGLRLNVGCGWDHRPGYVNVDFLAFHEPDVVADLRRLPFPDASAVEVVAQDVLEHVPRGVMPEALAEWSRVLEPGGRLVLRVPDLIGLFGLLLARPERDRQEELIQCLFGTQAYDGDFHMNGFTEVLLRHRLHDAGFEVESLVHRDEWLFDAVARRDPAAASGPLDLGALPFMSLPGAAPAADDLRTHELAALDRALAEARATAAVDALAPGPTRLVPLKKLVLRVLRLQSDRQAAHNRAVDQALSALRDIVRGKSGASPS